MITARAARIVAFVFSSLVVLAVVAVGCGSSGGNGGSPTKDAGGSAAATPDSGGTIASEAGGGTNGDAGTTTGEDGGSGTLEPGPDASVSAFNQTLICFGAADGGAPCSRTVDDQVTFPTDGTFSKITMQVSLNCPTTTGGCDNWDRVGSIDLVTKGALTDAGQEETLTELGRFVTPFGINPSLPAQYASYENQPPVWNIDVTELRPLLSGQVTLRAFIDTWSPQGDPTDNGAGWLITVNFLMTGGTPAKIPVAVLPIWTWTTTGHEPTSIPFGDPTQPIPSSVPPQTLQLPAGATSFGIRTNITGHGQANLDNCAEFCSQDHTWTVGTTANTQAIWRTDCMSFPSLGSYMYSRGGWCPGADVVPWDIDVSKEVDAGASTTFSYDVEAYTNTCNGLSDGGGLCSGCPVETPPIPCQYNGGSHTPPIYYVSALLIAFK
jgi:hypothetical protein